MEDINMKVPTDSIVLFGGEMKKCNLQVEKAINNINETYKKINTYWESTFWTQCYNSIEQQKNSAFQVCEDLKAIEKSVGVIAMNYSKVEKKNQVSASKLSGCVIK